MMVVFIKRMNTFLRSELISQKKRPILPPLGCHGRNGSNPLQCGAVKGEGMGHMITQDATPAPISCGEPNERDGELFLSFDTEEFGDSLHIL